MLAYVAFYGYWYAENARSVPLARYPAYYWLLPAARAVLIGMSVFSLYYILLKGRNPASAYTVPQGAFIVAAFWVVTGLVKAGQEGWNLDTTGSLAGALGAVIAGFVLLRGRANSGEV
jgi:hypothetical protein